MNEKKAELVDRLNAINKRIEEMGLGANKELIEMRDKILAQLDLLSNQEKDGGD